MANLKKEVMSLISRFDAAQEAFAANSVDLKKITKKHKKELKAAKAATNAALIEVEALKAELAILKAGGPAKPEAKAKPAAKKSTAKKPAAKRGPGRPKKKATPAMATAAPTEEAPAAPAEAPAAPKRKAGRPKKATATTTAKTTKKPSAGRPKKAATAAAKTTGAKRKGPGRPRTKPATPASPLQAVKGVGPAMAAQFEAAGVKTPAAMAKLSNTKMAAILANCGPRYRNADATKMQAYRDAAAAAK